MTNAQSKVVDLDARKNALDTSCSIAVQAPAGSGKTELLSLRFLKLLAICQHPEEVLAITFTKKAANEMAERILNTLEWAQNIDPNAIQTQLDHDRYEIANSVLLQDKEMSWQLQQSPNRLRIQTIDSFCNFLASRLPILSNFGGPLQISEQVDDCYQLAIRNFLKLLDSDSPIAASIAELMLHFDNDGNKLETLLGSLLKQREQWIGDIVGVASDPQQALQHLTDNLLELVSESIAEATHLLQPYSAQLLPLLDYATKNLADEDSDSQLLLCAGLDDLPPGEPYNLNVWIGLSELLLTKSMDKAAFRKTVNKNAGFPAASGNKEQKLLRSDNKKAMESLLKSLTEADGLLSSLDYLRRLPLPNDDSNSWDFLHTLTAVLPTLMAQLELAFTQKNKVDYPQVSLAAIRALGSEDNPTDLALSLDYQIKHILVDEFQDTSSSQMDLLKRLTAGWEPDDGRTLFVVGDAMQSCYGFRNANVGLFIRLRETGLGHIAILPIDLVANFRSDTGVVDWVNATFAGAFPAHNDISRGAVSYSYSQAVHSRDVTPAVTSRIYQYSDQSKTEAAIEEGAYIAEEISDLRKQFPKRKIAILVRSRGHLEYILPALREAEIPWLANEIDRLDSLPVITDLRSLTSAICNQADRLSWLAILRAPWCGISLEDLHLVASWKINISVYESLSQLCSDPQAPKLSADGQARIHSITAVLRNALAAKQHGRISRVIRSTFIDLGAELLIRTDAELDSVERFFEILQSCEVAGGLDNFGDFEARIANSFVSSAADTQANPVQIMTIHKSKGLEFDHVFLPGLARTSRADDKALLLWHQRLNKYGQNRIFLATLSATGSEDNNLYNLLKFEKAEKSRLESTRLLYIGVTRAMKSVYLSAALADKDGMITAPGSRTLLATIWAQMTESAIYASGDNAIDYITVNSMRPLIDQQDPLQSSHRLQRLTDDFFANSHQSLTTADTTLDAEDADEVAATVLVSENALQIEIGNLVHESLQNLVSNKSLLEDENLTQLRLHWRRRLELFSFNPTDTQAALDKIETSLLQTHNNSELSWIFDSTLEQSAAELAMQSYAKGYVQTHVVDRTFIDKKGVRWIIDYKSSEPPPNQTAEDFIDKQLELYSGQLNRYRSLFSEEQNEGVKTALLFTSIQRLVECATLSTK